MVADPKWYCRYSHSFLPSPSPLSGSFIIQQFLEARKPKKKQNLQSMCVRRYWIRVRHSYYIIRPLFATILFCQRAIGGSEWQRSEKMKNNQNTRTDGKQKMTNVAAIFLDYNIFNTLFGRFTLQSCIFCRNHASLMDNERKRRKESDTSAAIRSKWNPRTEINQFNWYSAGSNAMSPKGKEIIWH